MKLLVNTKESGNLFVTPSGSQTKNLMEAVKWPRAP